ncbi:hypothetical protein N9N03_01525 [Chlamydiia bacterium]|nr:hypothetical protein [Chlamydiia bacterium]
MLRYILSLSFLISALHAENVIRSVYGFNVCEDSSGEYCLKRRDDMILKGSYEECCQTMIDALSDQYGEGYFNIPFFTLGGLEFWTDIFWYDGYVVQEHCATKCCRLLNPNSKRLTWGTKEGCRTYFEKHVMGCSLPLRNEHLVILVHGLAGTYLSFQSLKADLEKHGFNVYSFNYASTRDTIENHTKSLMNVINEIQAVDTYSFVSHSMGGVVMRNLFTLDKELACLGDANLGRFVMVAPPNNGSQLVDAIKDNWVFKFVYGPAGQELSTDAIKNKYFEEIPCEFGIITALDPNGYYNPYINSESDLILSVDESIIPGVYDHIEVEGSHSTLMFNDKVKRYVIQFLELGAFS